MKYFGVLHWYMLASLLALCALWYLHIQYHDSMSRLSEEALDRQSKEYSQQQIIKSMQVDRQRLERSFKSTKPLRSEIIEERQNILFNLNRRLTGICINLVLSKYCERLQQDLAQLAIFAQELEGELKTFSWPEMQKHLTDLANELDELSRKNTQETFLSQEHARNVFAVYSVMVIIVLVIFMGVLYQRYRGAIQEVSKEIRKVTVSHQTPINVTQSLWGEHPELNQIALELRRLENKYQTLEKMKNAMLRHAAHELKTPLASIAEGCDVLSQELVGKVNPQQQEVLHLQNKSIERMNVLVERLLDYNYLLQYQHLHYSECALPELVNNVIADQTLALHKVSMGINLDCPPCKIRLDRMLFRRILDNVISNAMAHGMPDSQITLKITHSAHDLTIQCTNLKKVTNSKHTIDWFEPFQRGQHKRNDGVIGAGLGLSIIAECTKLLNGSIEIVETDSRYFELCINLPLEEERYENRP